MVSSSILSPSSLESQFPSVNFDHSYSKNSQSFGIVANQPTAPMSFQPRDISTEGGDQLEASNRNNGNGNTDQNNVESDMLCDLDLDDLDFSLFYSDMDTDVNAKDSFQDFVDAALSLSSSADVTVASGCASSLAATLGRQETVALSSSCSSDSMIISDSSPLVKSMEFQQSNSLPSEHSAPNSKSHNPIPTKRFSGFEFEPDCSALCLYSSCQTDQTTVSSSTYGTKLKPGDYLPPLYIDTHSYGITNFTNPLPLFQDVPSDTRSPCSDRNSNAKEIERQHFDSFVGITYPSPSTASSTAAATATATATTMCDGSSCVLTPLSLSDFSLTDNQKSLKQQENKIEQQSESCFVETPNSQFDDSVDDLDLDSISGFENYLTEASLDLRTLTSPSQNHSSISFTDCSLHLQSICDSQTKYQQRAHNQCTKEKDTESLSVSKLRLSILDDFSSKHELTSWLDGYTLDVISTPPISPGLSSPGWQEFADGPVETGLRSKQDTNILDLFSDDNAHAFLNDDSAICQLHVSQFV